MTAAGASGASGQWVTVRGELPAAVGQSYERGRRAGKDWRGSVGSHAWAIRADSKGGATYTLGEPPFIQRKIPVAAWRFEPAAKPARAAVQPLRAVPYAGNAANPWPPFSDGWFQTEPDAATRASLGPQMLGELPSYHYHDAVTPTGLYRLFAYETGAGHRAIGALRFWGGSPSTLGSLGDVPTDKAAFDTQVATGDAALAAGDFAGAVTAYQAAGQGGAVTLGPEIDAATNGASQPTTLQAWGINGTLATIPADQTTTQTDAQTAQGLATQMQALYSQAIAMTPSPSPTPATPPATGGSTILAAAIAMNNALSAHGYKQADQGLYRAFQTAANLTPDGFPGSGTMATLKATLAGAGITIAPVKVYPWLSSGSYDGVNAPTSAEWLGSGGGPAPSPPAPSPSPSPAPTPVAPAVASVSSSSGSTVALVAVAALAVGGIAWAAATGRVPTFIHKHFV